ncbi:MAG: CPBP family intramembrane metalloprotease [Bryobacterales bacterium]|nr:CPBP family intramembrane metalloprotease [Bryobacterales bacterium]
MFSVAVTIALFAYFWLLRDKLSVMGLEYVRWRRTPGAWTIRGIILGVSAAVGTAWFFRHYNMGQQPPFAELWIAVTWGPLIEEVVFRGYLYSLSEQLLRRWMNSPGWLIVVGIAVMFALSHLVKSGITPVQVCSVFGTGILFGWLRLRSGSTVPPVCAHISYNSVIYLAAAFLRQ